jgi:Nuclease-related domain
MAKVLGESGRYVSDQAVKQFRSMLSTVLVAVCILSVIGGFLIGWSVGGARTPAWLSLLIVVVMGSAVFGIWRWANPKLDALEKTRLAMRQGASGESAVALALASFPDDFCVINDLTTPFGNLDHVVVGPTGVFVLDTKNWRGVVSADGKGELLLNGKPTDKAQIRPFVARIMAIKEKVLVLAAERAPFFKAVFVFPSACVDAKWGSTSSVNCIQDKQLFNYIVETQIGQRLGRHEVEKIAQAFVGLAHMDKDFTSNPVSLSAKPQLQTA